jgi:hypothetical protein
MDVDGASQGGDESRSDSDAGVRPQGRPPIGAARTVRLPEDQAEFAIHVGGNFPEGVRLAVRTLMQLGGPLNLRESEGKFARRVGQGNLSDGLTKLLRDAMKEASNPSLDKSAPPIDPRMLLSRILPAKPVRRLSLVGDGDPVEGLNRLIRVSQVLGLEAIKKLDHATSTEKPDGS